MFSGFTVENMMSFLTVSLEHTSGDVRETTEKIIIQLYMDVGDIVRNYLPADSDRTRKSLLYKQLFTEFDKIDAQLGPNVIRVCLFVYYLIRHFTRIKQSIQIKLHKLMKTIKYLSNDKYVIHNYNSWMLNYTG